MESFKLVKDSLMDLAAIRGTAPLAIQAAEILDVDADLCQAWRHLLDHLAPLPLGHQPESQALKWSSIGDAAWAAAHLIELNPDPGKYPSEDVWAFPIHPFEIWSLETRDPEVDTIAQNTIDRCPNHAKVMGGLEWCPSLVRTPMACARTGRGEELPAILAAHYGAYTPQLANGLNLFENGIQPQGLEPSGMVATTLQEALVQTAAAAPGELEVILLFAAWPQAWDASFRLLVRGGFLITSSMQNGAVEFIEIESRHGEICRLRNPWDVACKISNVDDALLKVDGDLLTFPTRAGSHYTILPRGKSAVPERHIAPKPASEPVSYSFLLPSGVTVTGRLGRAADAAPQGLEPFIVGNRRGPIERARVNKRNPQHNSS